jgi:uncharacterized protein (TIGR03435 family)
MPFPLTLTRRIAVAVAAMAAIALSQEFEVASIKPNMSGDRRVGIQMAPGGRYVASGINTKFLIQQAYGVRDYQIQGGPRWLDTDRFDINAKAAGGEFKREHMGIMMQKLLADRFQLKIRRETKELPVYSLLVAKGGSKLKPRAAEGGESRPMFRMGRGQINAQNVGMAMFVNELARQAGRNVIDNTGLTGNFDVKLEWTPEPGQGGGGLFGGPAGPGGPGGDGPRPAPADPNGPTLFTAIQEQLGLKLEPAKGPVEIIVIDSVEKPSEN